jgi:ABC-type sugar transport system ATPase subunit
MATNSGAAAHVEVRGLCKSFGAVRAVRDVSVTIARGSVHALVGENGAGKSMLAKMIAGAVAPTAGEILVDGREVVFGSPRQALANGIAMVDQELALVPARSAMDNVFLGIESPTGWLPSVREQRARWDALLGHSGFDLARDTLVGSLSVADQQKVEILRALAREAEFIVMDEPTDPLTQDEAEQLYAIVAELRRQGTTILFISHFLEEVLRISDTVTVLRDGHHISTRPAADETASSLVRAMLGRPLELAFPERRPPSRTAEPILEVRGLSAAGRFDDVSFTLRPGEIVGMAGLVGSGRTEVLRAVFGADPVDGGELLLDGRPVALASPRQAIARGVVMLPESRKEHGLAMARSIAENMVISRLREVSTYGLLRLDRQRELVAAMMSDLDVRASGQDAPVRTLSGGNQQKVLFGKCLMTEPRVLLVDEPTRGVDVGAKRAIYELLATLAAGGMAVLVVSSELEEVLGLAHRVLVMCRGRLVEDLPWDEASEERVLAAAFGTAAA